MSVYIHRLETTVPENHYLQSFASDVMQKNAGDSQGLKRLIRSIYHHSGIRKRHSVITDFKKNSGTHVFFNQDGTRKQSPDTRTRNQIYTRESRTHFVALAEKLIQNTPGIDKNDITHVITVSCTGFYAPGPDYYVVKDLGLAFDTQRFHIGFMGCYAAFQALKMADAFCRSMSDAVVLVLCVELCSLHLQSSHDTDAIISASLFADGGSGAIVSARNLSGPHHNGESAGYPLEMISFYSELTPEGEEDMAWTVGNEGFSMKLSTYVPDIIHSNIQPVVSKILDSSGLALSDISHWAIHPGGRAILDKIRKALNLSDTQTEASRFILREYGNMSSATILFVLKEIAENSGRSFSDDPLITTENNGSVSGNTPVSDKDNILAMAFGPGLTIESALLRRTDIRDMSDSRSARSRSKQIKLSENKAMSQT